MDKKQAIKIICEAAKIYNEIFIKKDILIVYGNDKKPNCMEINALHRNFAHLTGVDLNDKAKDNSPKRFFEKARDHKLKEDDFEIKPTTEKKLEVLSQTLKIYSNARMLADYEPRLQNRPDLDTEIILGGERSYIGFISGNGKYIPNTLINGSIKNDSNYQSRVLAILSKKIDKPSYNEIKYVAKGIDKDSVLNTIQGEVSISPNLFTHNDPNIYTSQNVNLFSVNLETTSNGAAVLTPPRQTFGQALSSFFGKIKQFLEDKSTENRRLISELQKELYERNSQLSEKDDEISNLKKECANLSNQLEKQKQLVTTTAKPTRSFSQNLDDFAKRVRTENAAKSQSKPNHTHTTDQKR